MSIHIGAQEGQVADTVLLPGDPLRARYIAENYLEDSTCYNEVRGMLGYTGMYGGKRISVQGTGMGVPSISIYVHELIREYGVKTCIRIGSCGSFQPHIGLRDLILAMSACTDSQVNQLRFAGMTYAPTADFSLLRKAFEAAETLQIDRSIYAGAILTSDVFYHDDPDSWKLWADYGVLGVEMESSALYTIAAKFGVKALSILTVSDDLSTGTRLTAEDRQTTLMDMVRIALAVVCG